jgi:hypothetical protein
MFVADGDVALFATVFPAHGADISFGVMVFLVAEVNIATSLPLESHRG